MKALCVIPLICLTLLACGDQVETEHGNALIQPGRTIAGIELGVSAEEVRKRLGAPKDASRPSYIPDAVGVRRRGAAGDA